MTPHSLSHPDPSPPSWLGGFAAPWLRSAPLFPVAVGFIAGVSLDRAWTPPLFVGVSLFLVVVLTAAVTGVRRRIGPVLVLVAATATGSILHLSTARTPIHASIEPFARPDGPIVRLRGTVASTPTQLSEPSNPFREWVHVGAASSFLLEVESVEGVAGSVSASGRVRVTVASAVLDLHERERVEVFGRLFALSPPQNPGSTDWRDYYRRQGIYARLSCDSRRNVERLESGPVGTSDFLSWFRRKARDLLIDDVAVNAAEESTLLEAMVLGHRSRFDRRLDEIFTRAGVIHFIAVSGTNVVVLMSFVWFIGRLLQRTRRQCTSMMVVTILLYACLAEPRPPILRATIMGLFFCASLMMGRSRAHLNWSSAAVVVLVVIDPSTVFDVGFQLSFVAVLAVAYLGPAIGHFVDSTQRAFVTHVLGDEYAERDAQLTRSAQRDRGAVLTVLQRGVRSLWKTTAMVLAMSVAAWLVALPIVLIHFYAVQPWAPISSALVFPLMSLVMVLGLVKVVVGGISGLLDLMLGSVLGVIDRWLIQIVDWLSKLPGAGLTAPAPPWWVVVSYYAFLLAFVAWFQSAPRVGIAAHRSSPPPASLTSLWPGRATLLLLLVFVVSFVGYLVPAGGQNRFVMTVLSVGRGSTTVLELPDGHAFLYDAGSSFSSDVGAGTIVPFLCHRGIRRLDQVFVSHPNLDHFSGLPTVLSRIPAGPVIVNDCFDDKSGPRSPARYLLQLLAESGHSVRHLSANEKTWKQGEVTFEILWPVGACDPSLSANDASTVMRISFRGRSVLLTGDIEKPAQRALLERGDLHADVLVLPHHGSVESTTKALIQAVNPSFVIRSSSERTDQTVNGLDEIVGDLPFFNTADLGAIEVRLEPSGVRIACPQVAQYDARCRDPAK